MAEPISQVDCQGLPMTYVSYLRLSKDSIGKDGKRVAAAYGIDAQRSAVERFVGASLAAEYVETESGRKRDRPQLSAALAECKSRSAVLVIGKVDRLARDVRFFLEVLDDYGVSIRFAEFPDIDPKSDEGRMILVGMANFAEFEGRRISSRTKAALAAAKARGVKLGGYRGADMTNARKAAAVLKREKAQAFRDSVFLVVKGALEVGGSLTAAASILNSKGVPTSAGASWCAKTVSRVIR